MKKHLIFLKNPGIIYYSWLFIVLGVSLILGYEGSQSIVWPAIIVGIIFGVLLLFTWFNSYVELTKKQTVLKLPYLKKIILTSKPQLLASWHKFKIYTIAISEYQTAKYLVIDKGAQNYENRS